jgi:tRNA threonylcarbamoyladenosine biosynthesis protein TsaE
MVLLMDDLIFETDAFSPSETSDAGAKLATLILNDSSLPRFIALRGDLGAGKTEFTRGFASVASPGSFVKSPTYALVNEYKKGKTPLFHFDIYRLNDEDDLYSTGYFDYLDRGICLVEWFENIPECLPEEYYEVVIDKINDGEARRIKVYLR